MSSTGNTVHSSPSLRLAPSSSATTILLNMHSTRFASILFSAVPLVAGHGHVIDPPSRMPGEAFKAVCGNQLYSQQSSDINGNIQGEMQIAASQPDYDPSKCNLVLCKGFQYDDNAANIQSYSPGDNVDFTVDIAAPHTGVANVSVVDLVSNSVIGEPLISFDDYASNAHTIPENNTAFSITMPDVASQCSEAGACALQWMWDATSINQTYASCVDFTMGGSGTSPGSTGSSPESSGSTSSDASDSNGSDAAASSPSAPAGAASEVPVTAPTTIATLSSSTSAAAVGTSRPTSCKRRRKRNTMGKVA